MREKKAINMLNLTICGCCEINVSLSWNTATTVDYLVTLFKRFFFVQHCTIFILFEIYLNLSICFSNYVGKEINLNIIYKFQ